MRRHNLLIWAVCQLLQTSVKLSCVSYPSIYILSSIICLAQAADQAKGSISQTEKPSLATLECCNPKAINYCLSYTCNVT